MRTRRRFVWFSRNISFRPNVSFSRRNLEKFDKPCIPYVPWLFTHFTFWLVFLKKKKKKKKRKKKKKKRENFQRPFSKLSDKHCRPWSDAASDLGLHCLLRPVCPSTSGKYRTWLNRAHLHFSEILNRLLNNTVQILNAQIIIHICAIWSESSLCVGIHWFCKRTINDPVFYRECTGLCLDWLQSLVTKYVFL